MIGIKGARGVGKTTLLLQYIKQNFNFDKKNIYVGLDDVFFSGNSLVTYLHYLKEADLLHLLYKDTYGISALQKPKKIYFDNTNLIQALSGNDGNIENIRETFFINQLYVNNKVTYSDKSDFIINSKFTFEIGGKNKTAKQIKDIKNSFIVADNIKYRYKTKNPNVDFWFFILRYHPQVIG